MVVQAEAKNMMEVLRKARFHACFLAAQTMIVPLILHSVQVLKFELYDIFNVPIKVNKHHVKKYHRRWR